MQITGYGKGWQEEKATTRIARFRQIMREPATTTRFAVLCAIWVMTVALVTFAA